MTRWQHIKAAERLLDGADSAADSCADLIHSTGTLSASTQALLDVADIQLRKAQVHALLAQVTS